MTACYARECASASVSSAALTLRCGVGHVFAARCRALGSTTRPRRCGTTSSRPSTRCATAPAKTHRMWSESVSWCLIVPSLTGWRCSHSCADSVLFPFSIADHVTYVRSSCAIGRPALPCRAHADTAVHHHRWVSTSRKLSWRAGTCVPGLCLTLLAPVSRCVCLGVPRI